MLHVYCETRSFLQPFSVFCIDDMLFACSFTDSDFFSLYTFFEDVFSWTDEKFQAENRGLQELHERQWKNWHYVLARHKVRDATSKHLPCKVPQSLQFSQHTLLPTAHTCQWAIQRIKTKGVPFHNTFIQKHKLIFSVKYFSSRLGIPPLLRTKSEKYDRPNGICYYWD